MAHFFSAPDKEKNYRSYMVYSLAIIWSLITGIIVSIGFIFFPQIWQRWLVFLSVSFFISIFNLYVNHLGHSRIASWLLTIMLWLYITIPCYSAGGIMAPGILSQVSVILTAGFLIGWRGGIFIGILTIVTDFGFVYLEMIGQLPVPSVKHTPITRWIGAIIPFGAILALQYYATNHLRDGLLAMQREMLKREEAEKIKDHTLYELSERVKELRTLSQVSQLLQDETVPYENLFGEISEAIRNGWQFPQITAVRISIRETTFTSANYKLTEYRQVAQLTTKTGANIFLEVSYNEPMPESDEGPFLKEERTLINMLVELLKTDYERRERNVELKDYKYALDIAAIVSISDINGCFLFVNENFCKVNLYEASEVIGKHHSILWSGYHSEAHFDELKTAMETGQSFRGKFCNKAKDGSLYWVDSSIVPFLDEKGKVYQYISISHDITSQKNAEYQIKEQAEMFKAIIENTKESIYLISPDYKLIEFNTTAKERIKITRGKDLYIGADFRDYLFTDTTDIFYSMFEDSLNGKYRTEEINSKGINGTVFWFQSKTSPVYDLKGSLLGIRLLTESIDDRKKGEAILKESEEKFRSIVEQTMLGIYIIQDKKLIYINPGFEKIFGYPKEQLIGKISLESFIHADDLKLTQPIFEITHGNETNVRQAIFRAQRVDGNIIHIEATASLITYNNHKAIIGTLADITSRIEEEKRINQAVLDTQEKERQQIGMELHDNVKQILAGTVLFLDFAQNKLDDKEAVAKILHDLKKHNTDAITEV